ncbi:hypothetical protein DdX_00547 [Ditylenchus destructor]|uniref:Uncharacterized protein n=1 Tax=Ditylenchus destructor TaxID=166010 RepID=A0AAD4NH78_9BILA|nr:hypothetical protein DdX_00547 [Ditylenchus destructor]
MAKYNMRKRPTSTEHKDSTVDKSNKGKNSASKDNKAQEKKRKKKVDQVVREAEVTDVTDDKQTNPATPHSVLSDNAEFAGHSITSKSVSQLFQKSTPTPGILSEVDSDSGVDSDSPGVDSGEIEN